jgi:hypothetical protein
MSCNDSFGWIGGREGFEGDKWRLPTSVSRPIPVRETVRSEITDSDE